jgi:hypothetical protein
LLDFTLAFCLEGTPLPDSDGDSIIDEEDNCPEITNEDQSDIDNNGIGDVCDIFSALNLNISKKDTSCPNKSNGSISLVLWRIIYIRQRFWEIMDTQKL